MFENVIARDFKGFLTEFKGIGPWPISNAPATIGSAPNSVGAFLAILSPRTNLTPQIAMNMPRLLRSVYETRHTRKVREPNIQDFPASMSLYERESRAAEFVLAEARRNSKAGKAEKNPSCTHCSRRRQRSGKVEANVPLCSLKLGFVAIWFQPPGLQP